MKSIFKFFSLVFALFIEASSVCSIYDYRIIENKLLNELIESKYSSKFKDSLCNLGGSIFVFSESNTNEAFIVSPIFESLTSHLIKEIYIRFDIKNFKKNIFKFISSYNGTSSIIKKEYLEKYLSDDFKLLKTKRLNKFVSLSSYMKNDLGLKNYINFEKDGCVYYTVSSEDKLDDIHMIYESKDGNERREFVFTKSGIIPIEDTIGWQIQNGWNKFRNFFSFSTKHEEVKNEGYDYVDEHTKLKEKIY